MVDRAVTKALAGSEDITWGTGTEVQIRASGSTVITKIDAGQVPYENTQTLRNKLIAKAEILTNVQAMQVLDTDTAAELYVQLLGYTSSGDGGGGLFWLDTTDTTSIEDLSLIFNPDNLANGRWKRVDTSQQVSPDNGDANASIAVRSAGKHLFATNLTANRVVSLPATGLFRGLSFRVVRTDTGAFTLDVGGIATLPSGGKAWVEVTYSGTAWVQTAAGTLI